MYTWILSTGWWQSRAPVNSDAVVVVIILCACLIGGFVYLNRLILSLPLSMLSIKLYCRDSMFLTCFSFVLIALQSKFLKLNKEKIISVNATYDIYSFFILLMVYNPDILDHSAPSSSWRRS
jgi:hypothetical protein